MSENKNIREYAVVIDTTTEIPGLEAVAVKVNASSRVEAENFGWRWARDNGIEVVEITVYLK